MSDETAEQVAGPLAGVRVLCFTQFLLGPAAAQYLADMGADVIKVERPEGAWERGWAGGDTFVNDVSVFFLLGHRNVRSVAVDLKDPRGVEVCRRLAEQVDVVIGNFRSGVLERLGLGYEDLRARNPRLIYATASGYGDDSPYRDLPGQDLLFQAMTGLMAVTGPSTTLPTPAGAAIVDQHSGALLAMGVLGALVDQRSTGRGRRIEVNMLQGALDLQLEPATYWRNGGSVSRPGEPVGSAFHPSPYGVYAVRDGHVAISLSPISAIRRALDGDERLAPFETMEPGDALGLRDDVYRAVAASVAERSRDDLISVLRANDVWCAPVLAYPEVFEDPAIAHVDPFQTIEHPVAGPIDLLRHPISYDGQPTPVRMLPPEIGQHTREVLHDLIGTDLFDELVKDRVILDG
jgi:crotonobetainyl-CoA:carnitine CoA-transferase CaiB-like acyl-CoA transferase